MRSGRGVGCTSVGAQGLPHNHPQGVLNAFLHLAKEGNCLLTVDETVVVRQCNVHHRADHHSTVDGDWPFENAVHAEDRALRRVDDRGAHERSKCPSVADGDGASVKIFHRQLSVASLLRRFAQGAFDLGNRLDFTAPNDWSDQTLGSSNRHADVDKVVVDNVLSINGSVDRWFCLCGVCYSFGKRAHEPELDVMSLLEVLLVLCPHPHQVAHVNLVESGEEGGSLLRLFETAGHGLPNLTHLNASHARDVFMLARRRRGWLCRWLCGRRRRCGRCGGRCGGGRRWRHRGRRWRLCRDWLRRRCWGLATRLHRKQRLPEPDRVAVFHHDRGDGARLGRVHRHRELVRLDVDHNVVSVHPISLANFNAADLALGDGFGQWWQVHRDLVERRE
eukprot:m.413025 g.413025  ORF g.413025 m.413025 type:complete len:391 (+) comp29002_c0_seq1:36-1208(+)